MEQKKTASRGMAVLLSAALVPTVGVPMTAFADEADQAAAAAGQEVQAQAKEAAYQRDNVVDSMLAQDEAGDSNVQGDAGVQGGSLLVDPDGVASDGVYTTLGAALNAAEDGSTIVLDGDVNESVTVNKNVTIDGQGKYSIVGYTAVSNGTLQNLTLTSVDSRVFIIGSEAAGTNIVMDGVTVKYPLTTAFDNVASHVLSGNNAAIRIANCKFTNDAQNGGVVNDATQWSYGMYMNGQGASGSFTFENNTFDGAFRTMLANINGAVTIKDSTFKNSVYSVSPASSSGAGAEATCVTSADTGDATGFVITGNTFDNAGAFYFQKTAGANVSGNEFKFDVFEHFVQVKGSAQAPLDLSDNSFVMGENSLVAVDTTAAPVIFPAGQRAVSYWAWNETAADVKPVDYSTYEYAYNEDGTKSFYPGSFGALQAFINPKDGNVGVGKGESIFLQSDIANAQGIAVPSGKNFTLDFGGHSYTLMGPGAGSTGTETNAFQLLKDSNLTFKNGTIGIGEGNTKIKRIFQSYANVTFEDMTINSANQAGGEDMALSFNNGNVVMKGDTNIIASSSDVAAFDLYYWAGAYEDGVTVTFDESFTGNVTGKILYDSTKPEKAGLSIAGSGTFGGIKLSSGSTNGVTIGITGGTFSSDPSEYVADGYDVVESGGRWTVSAHVDPVPPTPQPDVDVEHRPDGSTVTTETRPDGSQTVTTESADGSQSVVQKDAEGNVTSTEVAVSDKAAEAGEVVLPIEPSRPAAGAEEAPAVEVRVPASVGAGSPVKVTVPVDVDGPDYGVVLYAVDAEGNEVLLPKCAVDAEGNAVFEAAGDVTVKVVDASPSFPDVDGAWYGADGTADFVGARGILTGMPQADGTLLFDGGAATTRAMFVTMLHRLESEPAASGEGFGDVDGSDWFAGAAAWGGASGVVNGYGDGSEFGGDDPVTREQMAVFAMRYAAWLGLDTSARADLSAFADGAQASGYAAEALSWAVAEGVLRGHADGSGRLDPQGGATRAEASAVVMRLVGAMYE